MTNNTAQPLYTLADGIEEARCYEYTDHKFVLIIYSNGTATIEEIIYKSGETTKYEVTNITEMGNQHIITGPELNAVLGI